MKFQSTYNGSGLVIFLFLTTVACFSQNSNAKNKATETTLEREVPANDISFLKASFNSFSDISTSWDDEWFYVSCDGFPEHNMMVGITNFIQHVPIDHYYTEDNSWAIPIQPVLAEEPLSTTKNFYRGAIAVAVNGIPIFNPLNAHGADSNEIGELDEWGGHCGIADDYHYHIPPTHLQSIVGKDKPIAYALDGFPVYGKTTEELDECLGRFNEDGAYQYHTIDEYPYLIAGMRGVVTTDPSTRAPQNQIMPQPKTVGVRGIQPPLKGAVVSNFVRNSYNSYTLTYTLKGESYIINYYWDDSNLYTYEFVNPDGTSTVETYQR